MAYLAFLWPVSTIYCKNVIFVIACGCEKLYKLRSGRRAFQTLMRGVFHTVISFSWQELNTVDILSARAGRFL